MDGVAILETEVRELIRRRGLDPVRDRPGVVALVTDAIADYDERSVVGAVPPLVDPVAAHKSVVDAVAGLGPLQKYLDDPEVEEIWINSPTQVFVARRGEAELTTTILTDGQVRDLVEKMLKVVRAPARPVQPVRGRQPAGRGAAARGDPGRHAAALVGEHPQVRGAGDDARRAGRPRLGHAARGRVPAGGRAGRAQRAGLRRDAGGQDDAAQRPGRRDPGAGAGHHVRGGLRAAARRARLGGDAVPAAEPRGHRGDPAAPAGQGGAAHAARTGCWSARCGRPRRSTCSSR